jgi:hypothetical protein
MSGKNEWRAGYHVWIQQYGRDRDDREYAASCSLCKRATYVWHSGEKWTAVDLWITETAGSRAEAWEIAKKHHDRVHAPTGDTVSPASTDDTGVPNG